MTKTVADHLVDMLVDAGVKRIYAITGDSLNAVNDAVRRNGKLEWIHVRHEETGAFAAGAEALLTGNIACCAGSSGPGHVHLINGLYDAHRSYAPVIALASTCPTAQFGTGYFQETDPTKLFADCSYYNQMAATPAQLSRMLQAAMQTAIERQGVSVVGLPGDVTTLPAADVQSSTAVYPNNIELHADLEKIAEAAKLINEAATVTVYAGSGAINAHAELKELTQRLNAPLAYTFKSKMFNQLDNPNEVGMNGLVGFKSGYQATNQADLLIMIGNDFPFPMLPTDKKIIQIDIRPEHLGRRVKLTLGIAGDAKEVLTALLPQLLQKTDRTFLDNMLAIYADVKKQLIAPVNDPGKPGLIHPQFVMHTIDKLADDDAIFTVDTGMNCTWAAQYINATGKRNMLASYFHGTMANAMPQALGAALACPDRQVIALSGDGGLSMLLGDLMTIVQYKLPVKIMIFDNRSLAMVQLEMEGDGLQPWQTDMDNPDFIEIAKAMGFTGIKVSEPDQVEPALKQAFTTPGPVIVSFSTDKDATPPSLF